MIKFFEFKGFTLAEVLITLGIIGVVAALTLPSVINHYKKIETVTALKEAYTIFYQVVINSQQNNGPPLYWDYTNLSFFVEEYILPYVKVIKNCGTNGTPLFCYDETNNDKIKLHLLNGNVEQGNVGYYSFVMTNGMGVLIRVGRGSANGSFAKFYVDINGSKGSTTIGKDVFAFSMTPDWGDKYIFLTGVTGANNSGVNNSSYLKTREHLLSTVNGGCNKNASSASGYLQGDFCSALIQVDGWEIKNDYPW